MSPDPLRAGGVWGRDYLPALPYWKRLPVFSIIPVYLSLAERLIGGLTATTLVQNDQHDAIRKMRIVFILLLITLVGRALGKLERDEIFVCETIYSYY